jgi:hypothetical protein
VKGRLPLLVAGTHHLLPFIKDHRLSEITAHEADRSKGAKVREREHGEIKRPLSNRPINKTLTRLGPILDAAVRYDRLDHNPVKAKVEKLTEAEPRLARLAREQVQVLLRAAGEHGGADRHRDHGRWTPRVRVDASALARCGSTGGAAERRRVEDGRRGPPGCS